MASLAAGTRAGAPSAAWLASHASRPVSGASESRAMASRPPAEHLLPTPPRPCSPPSLPSPSPAFRLGERPPDHRPAPPPRPPTTTAANRDELTLELVPAAALAKLQRMAQLLLEAQYMRALEAYAAQRDRALEQESQRAAALGGAGRGKCGKGWGKCGKGGLPLVQEEEQQQGGSRV